jgi:Domain of unknown function (DUF4037)
VVSSFVSGSQLAGGFYREVVRPLLSDVPHAAALLGWGSDVLGYDTERSMDHGWGPRLLIFVDQGIDTSSLTRSLDAQLPKQYSGRPVRFGWDRVPVQHWVTVTTLRDWLRSHLGVDASTGFSTLDWLVTPQQQLLGVVAGTVYADDAGVLGVLRARLAWYPDQVWRWLLACQWHRLAQEEAFVARTAEVGDNLGSALTAGRQVRELMRLALLLDRRYAPYQKWLGTAFARLPHVDDLPGDLIRATTATSTQAREDSLAAAYVALAERHNRAGLTAPVRPAIGTYHSRPAKVLMADRFTEALLATVTDPSLSRLPLVGGVDQHSDSTDVLQHPRVFRRAAAFYDGLSAPAALD